MIVSTLWGIFLVTAGSPLDQLGIAILGLIALALLALLGRRLQRHEYETESMPTYLRSSR
jgi:hypothetical protein